MGGQDTAVGDDVRDQLYVEESAVPADRDGVGDDGAVNHPVVVSRCELGGHDGLALDDRDGEPPSDGHESDKDGQTREGVLGVGRPERNHSPGLVHQGNLENDDEQQREDGAGDANVEVVDGDAGGVHGPEVVELVEGRGEVDGEEDATDHADGEAEDVQDAGGTTALGGGRHDEDDEQHDERGADLRTVADTDAEGLEVELVHRGHRDVDGSLAISREEGDVLVEGVEGFHLVYE